MKSKSLVKLKYADLSVRERISLTGVKLTLPFVFSWNLLTSVFTAKTWNRVLGEVVLRHLTGNLNYKQLQSAMGTSMTVYTDWAKANSLAPIIDDVGEDGKLLWIGPKRTDRVLLYCHGGGFIIPFWDFGLSFWRYVQLELEKRDIHIGIAVMSYTLYPEAVFPTPLRQASLAIEYLINSGVQPSNIQLAGDSAGGNLILQLLSHMLHPLPTIAPLSLPAGTRLRGAYLMSPWASLYAYDFETFKTYNRTDIVGTKTLREMGEVIRKDVPEEQVAYIDALHAPAGWFAGLDGVVERVLITAGGAECLRNADEELYENHLKGCHGDVRFCLQKDGVHDDPYFDFFAGGKKVGELTPLILEWMAEGFGERT